jgi:hypothetical protein
MSSIRTEEWVQKIALDSGQKVDWHMFAGRASILALGNLDKVRQAIVKNRDMHDKFLQEALQVYHKEIGSAHDAHIISGIWSYNETTYGIPKII